MHVILIHNPEAGEGHPTPAELQSAIEAAGHEVRYASTKEPGWELALDRPADLVMTAGGDGTVAKLVPKLAGRGVPLTVLPLGTANNIALSFGLPLDWRAIVANLPYGTRRRFDCGMVRGPWGACPFIESAGAGLVTHLIETADAEPVEAALEASPVPDRFDDIRRLCGFLLGSVEASDYTIEADGVDLSGRYLLVEAMNIRSIGPRLRLAPEADPGDGMLDLVLIDERARELFAADIQSWADNWSHATPWPVQRVQRVSISGKNLAWHVDDQPSPSKPAGRSKVVSGSVSVELTGYAEILIPADGGAA